MWAMVGAGLGSDLVGRVFGDGELPTSESESELQDDDENLPEDGEGGFVDAEDDEGYAVL